jgi:hypothetical protein
MASDMVKVTFTVDAATAESIRALAAEWRVPKSEAVRRAVRQAKENHLLQVKARTSVEVLEQLDRRPSLSAAEKKGRQAQVRRLRKDWGSNRRG